MEFSKIPSNAEVNAHEKPLFSFSAISDIHLGVSGSASSFNDDFGHNDLMRLFNKLGRRIKDTRLDLRYICCTGDIGYSSLFGETMTFHNIVKKECPIGADKVFSCNGNHDKEHTA